MRRYWEITVSHNTNLVKEYWQVPMSDADKEKTTFTGPLGLFQFTVMPLGLCGVPASIHYVPDLTTVHTTHKQSSISMATDI